MAHGRVKSEKSHDEVRCLMAAWGGRGCKGGEGGAPEAGGERALWFTGKTVLGEEESMENHPNHF